MKNTLLLLLTLILALPAHAQQITLTGQVSIHNSRYRTGQIEYVKGAYAAAPFTTPGETDDKGMFYLEFVGIDGGSSVALTVEKAGLEVVNARDLQDVIIGRKTPLRVYLADKGLLAQAQTELYNISQKALTARHEQLIARLRKEGAEGKTALQEIQEKLGREIADRFEAEEILNKQLEETQKRLPEFAQELAAVNLDFASDLYLQAYERYQNGDIERAIATLDETELDQAAIDALDNKAQLEKDKASIEAALQSEEERLQQIIQSYQLKARSHGLLFQYRKAAEVYEKAIALLEKTKPEVDMELARAYDEIGLIYKELGVYKTALVYKQKNVDICEALLSQGAPELFVAWNNLALVLKDLGDYQGAKALLEKVLKSAEHNFGPGHLTTAIGYSNLAFVLKILGDYQGAKELMEKTMNSMEENFGAAHPKTAQSYSNLALVLTDLGDYQRAKALLEKAMKSNELNFGPGHPTTAFSYSNLALALRALGNYQGAKELMEKTMDSMEENFGADHPKTAQSYSNLALVLIDLGDYQGAKALLEKAMKSDELNFGPGHPTTAGCYRNLATVLIDLGNYDQARRLLEKALAVFREHFGEGHPDTQGVGSWLKHLDALEKQNAPANNEAKLHLNAGNYPAAIEAFQKALPFEAQPAPIYNSIGLCYYSLKDYAQALQYYEQSYQLDSADAWIYLNNTGMAHAKSGNLEEAKRRFEQMQALIPNEGLPYRDWGLYYALKGDTGQALANLEKAVQLGYDNLLWIEAEEALEVLRGEARYRAVVEQLKTKD
jgi:tetratricopeptide (TPR) repeat protein